MPQQAIFIEGHTDTDPIKYSGFKSNWELSTARATEVVHFFVNEMAIDARRLSAVGCGEFQPVASNDTSAGKSKNRRVEIIISPKKFIKRTFAVKSSPAAPVQQKEQEGIS